MTRLNLLESRIEKICVMSFKSPASRDFGWLFCHYLCTRDLFFRVSRRFFSSHSRNEARVDEEFGSLNLLLKAVVAGRPFVEFSEEGITSAR